MSSQKGAGGHLGCQSTLCLTTTDGACALPKANDHMTSTGLADLEEIALTCRTERARTYIQEALAAYRGGATPSGEGAAIEGLAPDATIAEYRSKELLGARGIAFPPFTLAATVAEAQSAAERLGYPVVLKAQAAALPHKSDAGGVIVGLKDAAEVAGGWARLHANIAASRPDLVLDGVLVEKMAERGVELIVEARDPTILPKAVKNHVEQAGHRAAQARDGAALSRFLHWMAETAHQGGLDELSAAARLKSFRQDTGMLHDLSFDTISATGPNGAHCHYKVDETSNRAIEPNSIYLVDSGGQYLDGTTDVTRTIWVGPGQPTASIWSIAAG
eukprot:gene41617-56324_t